MNVSPRSHSRSSLFRPVMRDNETWTGEPEYEDYLYVRVFTPISQAGLPPSAAIRCCVNYGSQSIVTDRLDLLQGGSRGRQAGSSSSHVVAGDSYVVAGSFHVVAGCFHIVVGCSQFVQEVFMLLSN